MVRTLAGDGGSVGLVLRHDATNYYVMGVVNRDNLGGTCSLSINSFNGSFNVLANAPVPFPDGCPNDSYNLMTFSDEAGGNLVLNYRGNQVSYLMGPGGLVGDNVGMAWTMSAGVSQFPSVDIFRVMPAARLFRFAESVKLFR